MRRLLPILLLPAPSLADTGEASVRPLVELRYAPTQRPNPRTGDVATTDDRAFAYGGGVLIGLGLDFNWTATLRYGFDSTGELLKVAGDASQTRDAWTADRHSGLVGVAWTASDELTPLLMLEAGVAHTRLRDISDRRGGDQLRGAELDDQSVTRPAARLTVGYEWRFSDFWSVTAATAGEYADGVGVTAGLWLAGYSYTNWY